MQIAGDESELSLTFLFSKMILYTSRASNEGILSEFSDEQHFDSSVWGQLQVELNAIPRVLCNGVLTSRINAPIKIILFNSIFSTSYKINPLASQKIAIFR